MTQILTQLYRDANELELAMGTRLTGAAWDAIVLFVLDLKPGDFIPFAQTVAAETPGYCWRTYWSELYGRT